ncbi:MAG: hypothetical protein FGM37_02325 [Phycisphaerales bacterium]|nr:hypothetical protein [Phycisphaerales bacterium]
MSSISMGLAIGALAIVCGAAQAGVTSSGSYSFPTGISSPHAYNGTAITGLTPGSVTLTGVTFSSSNGNFRAAGWATGATNGSDTFTGSVDLGKYISFTLAADSGYTFDMTSIAFGLGRSGTGVRQWQWRSSADNFANALTDYTALNAGVTHTAGVLQLPDGTTRWTGNTLSTSGSAYQGLTSIEFRLYGFNAEGTAGTGGLQGPLTFTVNVIPAPGALALLGAAGIVGSRRRR